MCPEAKDSDQWDTARRMKCLLNGFVGVPCK